MLARISRQSNQCRRSHPRRPDPFLGSSPTNAGPRCVPRRVDHALTRHECRPGCKPPDRTAAGRTDPAHLDMSGPPYPSRDLARVLCLTYLNCPSLGPGPLARPSRRCLAIEETRQAVVTTLSVLDAVLRRRAAAVCGSLSRAPRSALRIRGTPQALGFLPRAWHGCKGFGRLL